ncbi:Hypothetical protein AT6N2_L1592 [Agrobacterium tumefaciens]|nr:Hypothetical protein AT6N2_L1592 [Agrobacterium tumefaciens]
MRMGNARPCIITGPVSKSGGSLGKRCLLRLIRPGEPGHDGFHIRRLDGRAGPDAQTGRCVTVSADIEGDILLFEQGDDALGKICLRGRIERLYLGINDFEADGRVGAGFRLHGQIGNPVVLLDEVVDNLGIGVSTADQRVEATEVLCPEQRVNVIFNAEHGRRVDGFAGKDAFDQLAAGDHAEDFRQRPGRGIAQQTLNGARRQDDDAMTALAAQNLLPREGDDVEFRKVHVLRKRRGCGVANGQALAVGGNEIGVGNTNARGRAVPCKDHVTVEIDVGKVRQQAIIGLELANVLQLQLLDNVGDPASAEAFPGQHIDATFTEQRPERHFNSAGVGCRNDADTIIGGNIENFTGEIDGLLQLGFANLGAMRATERCIGESI